MRNKKLLERARFLRKDQTDAENLLWRYVRAHRLLGAKFKRQYPVGCYIVDFICIDAKLIVELDGSQHLINKSYDNHRDIWLIEQGYCVLRFWNNEIFENPTGVLERIIERLPSPPAPLPQAGEGSVALR